MSGSAERLPATSFDSVIVVSFGGPDGPADVMPFLRNVTRGRNVPEGRLTSVAEHYYAAGGKSPINEQNLALIEALRDELAANGPDLPVYWGNRNWAPYITDTLAEMRDRGHRRTLAFVTSAFSSYSGCRQYRQDIEIARSEVEDAPEVVKLRQFFNHPGFIDAMVDNVARALDEISPVNRESARLVFSAHSIPISMATVSRYEAQLREAARLVATALARPDTWDFVFQSRSGAPDVPWLEPDINDHLRELSGEGVEAVVVVPIGFISDHMEVAHDLDDEARETADGLGLEMARAETVGTDPRFVSMIRDLILEQVQHQPALALGEMGAVTCLGDECCIG